MSKLKKATNWITPVIFIIILLVLWELCVNLGGVEKYIMPAPSDVFRVLFKDMSNLFPHMLVTLYEGFIGFLIAIILSLIIAVLMDSVPLIKKALYPVLIISQTVPTIALAPLFIIWFGFGTLPKIIVVVIVCFFPIVISLADGLANVDKDLINHFKLMGASRVKTFIHLKLPYGIINLFSGLKIAATYSIMGAVIGEWLGGDKGLGVYMTRARSSYALDKMFASIILIIVISMLMFLIVGFIEKRVTPWKKQK